MSDDDFDDYDDENATCWQCGGEKYLIAGEDIDVDDPVNGFDWSMGVNAGQVGKCPCCKGSGKAEDCTYW